ncbi:MAG: hypothetical protein NTV81_01725 [Candidatus Komeilibacteria bacterium]|nr:hypothetical protein [Candidatus Komeilibacteria bacterium]
MFYKKNQAEKFLIPGGTEGLLFPSSPKGDQTVAVVEMDGVYPASGYSLNDFCTETIYLIEGLLEAEVSGEKYVLQSGDLLVILPGNKYKLTGQGKSVDLITPAWDKSQNHIIE